jgi:hypothetical protein
MTLMIEWLVNEIALGLMFQLRREGVGFTGVHFEGFEPALIFSK